MRRAHTVEQVRAAEAALMATLPAGTLMDRAATGLAYAIEDFLGGVYGRRVLLLAGTGDNGGDALLAGRKLSSRGARTVIWRTGDPPPSGRFDVVVDGIVGIGGKPGLRPDAVAALEAVRGVPVVAVDLPSGIDVDAGETPAPHVTADLTVTFGTLKACHLVDPAAAACGVVHLVDIGLSLPEPAFEALQAVDVAALLPSPSPQAQKYARGVVGLRTGSADYPGAALLSVAGANTGLAGMVRYVGSGPDVADTVKQHHPEVVGPGRVQAWVVGSGGGADAARHLEAALADEVPVVIDADGLGHLGGREPLSGGARTVTSRVLTPHAGELAGLLGVERDEVEARPLAHLTSAVERFACTVLLKGRRTLVGTPGRPVRVNTTGTPWLATAGAGDVLAGLIGSLLAAGLDPHDAASVGAWLHGAAATTASDGGPLTASRVAAALPAVIADLARMRD